MYHYLGIENKGDEVICVGICRTDVVVINDRDSRFFCLLM